MWLNKGDVHHTHTHTHTPHTTPICCCMWLNKGDVPMPPGSLHWKLTLGEKSLLHCGLRTRISTAPGFSARRYTIRAIPALLKHWPTGQVCWLTIVFRANRTSVLADQHCFQSQQGKCVGWPSFSEPTGQVCWLTNTVFRANRVSVLADQHCFQSQQGKCVGWPTLFSVPHSGGPLTDKLRLMAQFPSAKDMVQPRCQTWKKRFL